MDRTLQNGTPQAAPDFSAIPVTLLAIAALFSEDGTRLSRNEEHIRALEDDFRRRMREHPAQHPVQTPLRVIIHQHGERYQIIAGNYRYLAGLRIPLRELPCQVLPHNLDEMQLFIEQHRDNALHEGYSPVELARNILHVKEKLGCSQVEAGRKLGIDNPAETTKLLSVLKLPEDLLEKIGEGDGKLPFTSAYPLSRLRDEAKIRELADKAMRGLLCRDRLVEVVDGLLHGTARQRKPKPLKVKLDGVQVVASNPTLEGLQAFAEQLLATIKKLLKDGDGIEFLPARLKGV